MGHKSDTGIRMADTYHDGGNRPLYDGHGEEIQRQRLEVTVNHSNFYFTCQAPTANKTTLYRVPLLGGPSMADWRSKWSVKFNDAGTSKYAAIDPPTQPSPSILNRDDGLGAGKGRSTLCSPRLLAPHRMLSLLRWLGCQLRVQWMKWCVRKGGGHTKVAVRPPALLVPVGARRTRSSNTPAGRAHRQPRGPCVRSRPRRAGVGS